MKHLKIFYSVFVLLITCSQAFADTALGAKAPDFTLTNQDGNKISLADSKGKFVVLHWTNSGCPFIKRHYKQNTFNALVKKYEGSPVVFYAIDSSNYANQAALKTTHDEQKLTYNLLLDETGVVGKAYGAKTTPHVFILDKEGKLVYHGAVDDDAHGDKGESALNYVSQALDELIAVKAVSMAENASYGCSVKYK